MGTDVAYQQLWRVVDGAVRDCFRKHGDYLTPKGRQSARRSVNKRVVGTVLGFALQEAARQRELAVTGDLSARGDHQAAGVARSAAEAGALPRQPIHSERWEPSAWLNRPWTRYRFASRFAKTSAALQRAVDIDRLCFAAVARAMSRKAETEEVLGRGNT